MSEYYGSFDEIINFLNCLIKSKTEYIYRGYNHDDEIYPAIIRDKNYAPHEEDLLNEFEKYGLAYFLHYIKRKMIVMKMNIIK